MPWGQKNRRSEMIHSQMVTPPLAAMEGTTFRLKTATTNSNTRSRRPRARIKRGWMAGWVVVDNARWSSEKLLALPGGQPLRLRSGQAEAAVSTRVLLVHAGRARRPPHTGRLNAPLALAGQHALAALSPMTQRYRRRRPGVCRCRRR